MIYYKFSKNTCEKKNVSLVIGHKEYYSLIHHTSIKNKYKHISITLFNYLVTKINNYHISLIVLQ